MMGINVAYGQMGSILLITPGEYNTYTHPVFSWSNVSWSGPETVKYSVKLVELLSGQNGTAGIYAALQYNTPVFYVDDLTSTSLSYPVSAPSLNECGRYAWQVQAYIEQTVVNGEYSQTVKVPLQYRGVALFLHDCNTQEPVFMRSPMRNYIIPDKKVDPFVYKIDINQDTLYLRYKDEYLGDSIRIQLYAYEGDSVMTQLLPDSFYYKIPNRIYNYIHVPFSAFTSSPSEDQLYFLEVKGIKGDLYRAKLEFEEQ